MPIPSNYVKLLEHLAVRTAEGKVNWRNTAKKNTFAVYLKEFALTVSEFYNEHPEGEGFMVTVTLLNAGGDEIDSFNLMDSDVDYAMVSSLHSSARRKALRIDEALNTMLHELKTLEKSALPPLQRLRTISRSKDVR